MPPNDTPAKSHLIALGTAAVLAVYSAGFVRTQSAADRLEAQSRRRRPAPQADVAIDSTHVSAAPQRKPPTPSGPAATPKPDKLAKTKPEHHQQDSAKAIVVAEKPAPNTPTQPAVDTATKAPIDSAMVARDLKDGVYTGWGTSRHGDIEARIEIRSGRIISATISQCLTMYSVYWVAGLPPQVVKRQSPEVDFVSGATESTNAFYYGVVEALKKAK